MPEVIPLDRIRRMLDYAKTHRKEALGWLALGLFAGLRSGEIDEITWDDVKLEDKLLIVRRGKLRTRRPKELPEAAIKWLDANRVGGRCGCSQDRLRGEVVGRVAVDETTVTRSKHGQ